MATLDRHVDGMVRSSSETAVLLLCDWDAAELRRPTSPPVHWNKKFFMFRTGDRTGCLFCNTY